MGFKRSIYLKIYPYEDIRTYAYNFNTPSFLWELNLVHYGFMWGPYSYPVLAMGNGIVPYKKKLSSMGSWIYNYVMSSRTGDLWKAYPMSDWASSGNPWHWYRMRNSAGEALNAADPRGVGATSVAFLWNYTDETSYTYEPWWHNYYPDPATVSVPPAWVNV